MRMTNEEVRHGIINSKFPYRFANGSTVLEIERIRLHPFHIALLADCLKPSRKSQVRKQTKLGLSMATYHQHLFIWNDINVIEVTTVGIFQH